MLVAIGIFISQLTALAGQDARIERSLLRFLKKYVSRVKHGLFDNKNVLKEFPMILKPEWLLSITAFVWIPAGQLWADDKPAAKTADAPGQVDKNSATTDTPELKFVRVLKQGKQPQSLQTAVVTYKSDSSEYAGVEVTLIGAVHIAEKAYYEELNKLFKSYDALLYEMVSDPKQRVPSQDERGTSPVSAVQVGMKDMLQLKFQLDEVDYKPANFVHADMSPEEFFESMKKRKEGVLQMLLRSVGSGLAMQGAGKANDLDMLSAMFSENRAQGMKRVLADQFEMMDGQMAALQGEDGRSTLITERNAKAFAVLSREIKAGKKKLGIFYGAGHLEDMHKRLVDDYRMQPVETRWLDAWDLK